MNLTSHQELNNYLFYGKLDKDPYEIEGFLSELKKFIHNLGDFDYSLVERIREEQGVPNWTSTQQIHILLDFCQKMFPTTIRDKDSLEREVGPRISFFDPTYIKERIPRGDVKTSEISVSVDEIIETDYDFNRAGWMNYLKIILPYVLSVKQLSKDSTQIIRKTLSRFGWHEGLAYDGITQTKYRLAGDSNDAGRFPSVNAKLHHPSLSLMEVKPYEYSIHEYPVRMHELVHVLEDIGALPILGKNNDVRAESISSLTLLVNGINLGERKLSNGPYYEGRMLAFIAKKTGNPAHSLFGMLFR